jgi:CRISPR/Cas system-associated exonuclease Cas4 (RecB family)
VKFLRDIASAFYGKDGDSISRICFVFPNRRAGIFFRDALGQQVKRPLFSPSIITVEELFSNLSSLKKMEKPDTLFRLYEVYCEISERQESFDDFYFWGEMLLSDFDDTDKYLADAGRLFANIKDLRDLESDYAFLSDRQLEAVKSFWNSFLPGAENSDNKKKFRSAWEILYPLYSAFRSNLARKGYGYEGMLFREVAEKLQRGLEDPDGLKKKILNYSEYVFVGFNALNPCEKILLKELKNLGVADFYWDFQGPFVTDPQNKASEFISENIHQFPSKMELAIEERVVPSVELIAVPSSVGQARIISQILKKTGGDIDTAVVLPDSSLLMPILNSLPEEAESVNVTMGYPLRYGAVVSLAESIIELQKGVNYFRRVLPVLKHNYVRIISGDAATLLIEKIVSRNMVYINQEEFHTDTLLSAIFRKADNISDYLLEILDILNSSMELSPMEKEFNFALATLVAKLKGMTIRMNADTYLRLLKQLIASTSVPFNGEPLSGLQIMGVLETRALDFRNIIICSMNEGVFPKTPAMNSFIPLNLRRGFGMPSYEHWDALSAYSFYRLVTGAEKVFLLYDTRSEELRNGEVSRFVHQLRYHYGLPVKDKIVVYNLQHNKKEPLSIKKESEVLEKTKKFIFDAAGKISATGLNDYIDCPLRFYFKYIKGVTEEEEVSEGVEADTFGSIFHKSAELLYGGFRGKTVTREMLKNIFDSEFSEVTSKAFETIMGMQEVTGRNIITYKLIIKYLRQLVRYDSGIAPFDYIDSEKRCFYTLKLDDGNKVIIKGILDRIDSCGGVLRIVDYKTGSAKLAVRPVEELFAPDRKKDSAVTFQMYLYSLLLDRGEVKVSTYNLRSLFSGEIPVCIVDSSVQQKFEIQLRKLVKEVVNPEVPFMQTSDTEKCKFCPYNLICR